MTQARDKHVSLGRISGVHGVRGWFRLHSYTEPRDNIVRYRRWRLTHGGRAIDVDVEQGRPHGKTVIAKLAGIADRDAALEWVGAGISVPRTALPPPGPDEYYWADLAGLAVVTADGTTLGRVDHLIETGTHDVLVLDGGTDRLIPFAPGRTVLDVDLDRGRIVVDWHESYWDR